MAELALESRDPALCSFYHSKWLSQGLLSKFIKSMIPSPTGAETWEDPSPVILSWWTFSWKSVRLRSSVNIHSFTKCVLSGYDVPSIAQNTEDPAGNKPDPWKHACPDIGVCGLIWEGVGGSDQVLIWLQGKRGEFKRSTLSHHALHRSPLGDQWSGNYI